MTNAIRAINHRLKNLRKLHATAGIASFVLTDVSARICELESLRRYLKQPKPRKAKRK